MADATIMICPAGVVRAGPAATAVETNEPTIAWSSAMPAPTSPDADVNTAAISVPRSESCTCWTWTCCPLAAAASAAAPDQAPPSSASPSLPTA
ncbi:hypothetical protein [Rhodococcus sp. NPDC003348]